MTRLYRSDRPAPRRTFAVALALCAAIVLLADGRTRAGASPAPAEAPAEAPAPAASVAPAEDDATCRVVQVEMTPSEGLQIVVWIEDSEGNYVDTAYITELTGTYGLGNRPGMMDFNTAYRWPYGRRTTTFPVWAHRHGMTWPLVVFQDRDDEDLSHPMGQSSVESFYCRPISERDEWDAQTCATVPYTDKGALDEAGVSRYPPRADVDMVADIDDPAVAMFDSMNPFDAVSRATPAGGEQFQVRWQIPAGVTSGEYVAWVEVSKELDQNDFYAFPAPDDIPWLSFGVPYRGQPSVVYRVPFTISAEDETVASASEYVGYGDPGPDREVPAAGDEDRPDGDLRPPDGTITTDVPGSGAARLLLTASGDDMYRVRVHSLPSVVDTELPGVPEDLVMIAAEPGAVTIAFTAPGDDDDLGPVAGYEVRYLAGEEVTLENFDDAVRASVPLAPAAPGEVQELEIEGLLPRMVYSVGIRAVDECGNVGGLAVVEVSTPEFPGGEVDYCFVATAAYGSLLEREVAMLRRFRDRYLRTHVTGELLVESYYTFGPALAKLIGPSDTLRRAARAGLAPVVEQVRRLAPAR
ncbi:CFI-box-CTERM domain-containing protein [Haliangium sp.]|uniref:CFI-box-CTERM domain-containing protein n=1 Tax=Haliangium sp. TaxID=2663208 RepID=UPI003D10FFAC